MFESSRASRGSAAGERVAQCLVRFQCVLPREPGIERAETNRFVPVEGSCQLFVVELIDIASL